MSDFSKATPGPWHVGGPHFGRYDVWAQEHGCARQSIAVMHAFGKKGSHYGDMFAANAALIADAGTVWGATGKTPSQLAADLAAAQEEAARLRAALEPSRSGPDFYDWLADRLVHKYGEDPNVDFVLTLRRRAALGRQALNT